ncbi:MAG: hypothetical protein ACMG6H_03350 [Acidobacteriota bacterium]
MRQLGWIEGQSIVHEHAYPRDRPQDLPWLLAELVERKPDRVYALSAAAALAAKCGYFRGVAGKIAIDRC